MKNTFDPPRTGDELLLNIIGNPGVFRETRVHLRSLLDESRGGAIGRYNALLEVNGILKAVADYATRFNLNEGASLHLTGEDPPDPEPES